MAHTPLDEHILNLLEQNGEMRSRAIYDTKPETSNNTIRGRIGKLKKAGKIEKVENGLYRLAPIDPQTAFREKRKKFSSDERAAEDNEDTINALLNTYDEVLVLFQSWVFQNLVSEEIDFAQQLIFLENFKWLTAIADKLMRRWSLVHVGYDTNTRQAQEDAKAKAEKKQQEALKNAPIEDQIIVVGHYRDGFEEILAKLPKRVVDDATV